MESLWLHSIIGLYHFIALIAMGVQYSLKLMQDERFWQIIYMGSSFLTIWNFVSTFQLLILQKGDIYRMKLKKKFIEYY